MESRRDHAEKGDIRNAGGDWKRIYRGDHYQKRYFQVFCIIYRGFHTFDIDPTRFNPVVEKLHEAGDLYYVADLSRGIRKSMNE